jgi:hypothetical protein
MRRGCPATSWDSLAKLVVIVPDGVRLIDAERFTGLVAA